MEPYVGWLMFGGFLLLVWIGTKVSMAEAKHKDAYIDQTFRRRQFIRKLYDDHLSDTDWQHMARVIQHGGFRDQKGEILTTEQIKQEHAQMVLLDLKIDSQA